MSLITRQTQMVLGVSPVPISIKFVAGANFHQIRQTKLEMMFMKHYAPNPLHVKKDGTRLSYKGLLKFEAPSYTTHHPSSVDLI